MSKDQMEIPGTERPKIKPIEEAARAYVDVRDRRMSLTEKEVASRTKLVEVMQKHVDKLATNEDGDFVYRFDDEIVVLSDKTTVKVRGVNADSKEE